MSRGIGLVVAMAAALVFLPPAVEAQTGDPETRECRCVDRSGEEIENCTCILPFGEADFGFGHFTSRMGRARLGVEVSTAQEAAYDRDGVLLQGVQSGTPAYEAGLRTGDVVTHVGGRALVDPLEDAEAEGELEDDRSLPVQRFLALARELEPDAPVRVDYLRNGDRGSATVTPEATFRWTFPGGEGQFMTRDGEVRWFGPEGNRAFGFRFDPEEGRAFFRDNLPNFEFDAEQWRDLAEGMEEWQGLEGLHNLEDLGEIGARFMRHNDLFDQSGDASERYSIFGLDDRCRHEGGELLFGSQRSCVDGAWLIDLNPQLADYFEVDGGVLVTQVGEGSTLGLQAGDVIRRIGDREVEATSDVRRILRSYEPEESVTIEIVRRGEATQLRGTRR